MRIVSILLFVATIIIAFYGFESRHAMLQSRAAHSYADRRTPIPENPRTGSLTAAQTEEYLRIILTLVLVPFCMILVFMKSQDGTAKAFSFTSLGIIIAYWLHSAT